MPATTAIHKPAAAPRAPVAAAQVPDLTLLELVQAVSDVTEDDREVVATVAHMIRSGRVRLCGNFRDEPRDCFDV